jgi:ATP/maltotriose-dependent transcriptional regulator MalT
MRKSAGRRAKTGLPAPRTESHRLLETARKCYEARAWGDAFDALQQADASVPLDRDDLERLAWSAGLIGKNDVFLGALERLHKACVELDEHPRAARAAFWIGFRLLSLGSRSGATGWLARAGRLVEHVEETCAERGYLLLPTVYRELAQGSDAEAEAVAREAAAIGERCRDGDLVALARQLESRAQFGQGRSASGLALLDEVMVATTSGELSPLVTGIVYCSAIDTCRQFCALDRAREWTSKLASWCEQQPQLVTFTGLCLIHRAEIMQLCGDWNDAIEEVRLVCERLNEGDPEIFGDACYQQAELFRLRGDVAAAEDAYRRASENGREPQPGLALLRLAQGQPDEAICAVRRVLSTTRAGWQRARLLPAFVEIALAAGRIEEADQASRELDAIARELGTEILAAMAAHARGAVALAAGDARNASERLRHAFDVWHRAGVPYIAARIRVLLGRAFLALGDRDGAALEVAAARKVFEQLGATFDLERLPADTIEDAAPAPASAAGPERSAKRPREATHGLSAREIEVLRLVARGMTNKAIAIQLFLSERTVDRHVSNIFTKIDVASRAAATAFAYENGIA